MLYRMRVYEAAPQCEEATRLFETFIRPVHESLGAELIGRGRTSDGRTVVIWGYESEGQCARILKAAQADPMIVKSREERESAGLASVAHEEVFMTSTLDHDPR